MDRSRWLVVAQLVPVALIAAALIFWGGAPYIVTAAVLAVLTTLGHLVTLDDDFRGGWSNPEGSRRHLWLSLLELGLKAGAAVLLFWLMARYPWLKQYRW